MQKTLKEIIRECLSEKEECRNSDKILMVEVFRKILIAKYGTPDLDYIKLLALPPQSSIKRIRALIQNDEGLFIPTDEKTAHMRRWNNELWKDKTGMERLFAV